MVASGLTFIWTEWSRRAAIDLCEHVGAARDLFETLGGQRRRGEHTGTDADDSAVRSQFRFDATSHRDPAQTVGCSYSTPTAQRFSSRVSVIKCCYAGRGIRVSSTATETVSHGLEASYLPPRMPLWGTEKEER